MCSTATALLNSAQVVKCCSMLSEIALQAPINSIERQMLLQNVQVFYDTMGGLDVGLLL